MSSIEAESDFSRVVPSYPRTLSPPPIAQRFRPEVSKERMSRQRNRHPSHDRRDASRLQRCHRMPNQLVADALALSGVIDIKQSQFALKPILKQSGSTGANKAEDLAHGIQCYPDFDSARASAEQVVPKFEARLEYEVRLVVLMRRLSGAGMQARDIFGIGELG